jgi:hypothetical protein
MLYAIGRDRYNQLGGVGPEVPIRIIEMTHEFIFDRILGNVRDGGLVVNM